MNADGRIVSASHIPRKKGLQIKSLSNGKKAAGQKTTDTTTEKSEPSLLSRLGITVNHLNADEHDDKANGKSRQTKATSARGDGNGHLTPPPRKDDATPPFALLAPYDTLLQKAGVASVSTLRRLVRPETIKEYIEMLAENNPDEELLRGLTAKWALRERLEQLLGENNESTTDWGIRPSARH